MSTQYIVQTRQGEKYTELFKRAVEEATYTEFIAAAAYATVGGVNVLNGLLEKQMGTQWGRLRKRWLVGIDWCRSDPPALARLAAIPRSQVRVPNGQWLVQAPGCTPQDTYHPKLFVFSGPDSTAIICGSGNLSANALQRGCECGSLLLLDSRGRDASVPSQLEDILTWFQPAWRKADPYLKISTAYEAICQTRVRRRLAAPTDDDTKPVEVVAARRRGLSEEQIRALRSFDHFWIEAGALGANLGAGVPGNQLDMTRFTRAFFGAPVDDVPVNTVIDAVTLVWEGETYGGRTLKFGDNGMDKLNVPPAGDRGRLFYAGKTLLFTRQSNGEFLFDAGDAAAKREWRKRSKRTGVTYPMPGGREWGLF